MENQNEIKDETKNESNQQYIDAINNLKATTVNKDEYIKLQEENKNLLNSLVTGQELNKKEEIKSVDVNELRKKLSNSDNMSNLEYVQTALELRTALMENGSPDPFLPIGKDILVSDEDISEANKVANALQTCADYADGDSNIFTNELQRIMVNTGPVRKRY